MNRASKPPDTLAREIVRGSSTTWLVLIRVQRNDASSAEGGHLARLCSPRQRDARNGKWIFGLHQERTRRGRRTQDAPESSLGLTRSNVRRNDQRLQWIHYMHSTMDVRLNKSSKITCRFVLPIKIVEATAPSASRSGTRTLVAPVRRLRLLL